MKTLNGALAAGLVLIVCAGKAFADSELDLSVGKEMFSAEYNNLDDEGGSLWGFGGTYSDDSEATAVFGSFNVIGQPDFEQNLITGLGLQAVVHDTFQTALSLALGGTLRLTPEEFNGLGVEARFYYAPEIFNTHDAERYHEIVTRLFYTVHPRARVFVGWTDRTVKYDDAEVEEVEINHALNVGFTLNF